MLAKKKINLIACQGKYNEFLDPNFGQREKGYKFILGEPVMLRRENWETPYSTKDYDFIWQNITECMPCHHGFLAKIILFWRYL